MPKPEKPEELLRTNMPEADERPSDNIVAPEKVPTLDLDVLGKWIMERFREAVNDKGVNGFYDDLVYDYRAYYGLKDEFFSNWPWPNASNFPVPITPVLVDTAWAGIQNIMFPETNKVVKVGWWGQEDATNAGRLSRLLNYQHVVESDAYGVQDTNIFKTLFNGTGFIKTFLDWEADEFRIRHSHIPAEFMYGRVKSNGLQPKDTDFVIQIIPLNETEYQRRLHLRVNGKKYYDNLEGIPSGITFDGLDLDMIYQAQSQSFGLDVTGFSDRSQKYLGEIYCTYYPPASTRPLELIVAFVPSIGKIAHVKVNVDRVRPYGDYYIYKNPGMMFHMSAPRKIREIQLKANYVDKQVTDAADKAISQIAYIEKGSRFDPSRSVRVPSGMYEIAPGSKVTFESVDLGPIVERSRQEDALWDKAERLLGFTDLYQGTAPDQKLSATTDTLRFQKSEGRVGALARRYGLGWKKTNDLVYFYNDKQVWFEKRGGGKTPHIDKIQKVVGFDSTFTNIEQLFPGEGNRGKYDFLIAGGSDSEVAAKKAEHSEILDQTLEVFKDDKAQAWRILNKKAELTNFTDFREVVPPPREVDIEPVEKLLSRIEGGETNLIPSPLVDTAYYLYKLNIYMTTARFKNMESEKKVEIQKLHARVEAIQKGKEIARQVSQARTNPAVGDALGELVTEAQGGGAVPAEGSIPASPEGGPQDVPVTS